jgi:hypothetical protein
MTIIIHGFGSAGKGGKAMLFREYFKRINKPCIAPSLSYVPELAIDTRVSKNGVFYRFLDSSF